MSLVGKKAEVTAEYPIQQHTQERIGDVLASGSIKVFDWPFEDVDVTITWTGGKPSTIVYTSYNKTKTLTLSWTGDELNSVACVIT